MKKKLISIVTPTYNEEDNIDELYSRIKLVTSNLQDYIFEIIVIDNSSTDNTSRKLRAIAEKDKSFKVILNEKKLWAFKIAGSWNVSILW